MNYKFEFNKKYFTISIYAFGVIVASLLFFKFVENWEVTKLNIKSFINIISPFLIAFLIAYLLYPLIHWTEIKIVSKIKIRNLKITKPKTKLIISIFLVYVVFISFIVLTLFYVVPEILNSINILIIDGSSYLNKLYKNWPENLKLLYAKYPAIDMEEINDKINDYIPSMLTHVSNILSNLLPILTKMLLSLISSLLNFILSLIIAFYMIIEKDRFINKGKNIIYAFFSNSTATKTLETIKHCNSIFTRFVIGKALDSLIIGFLCFIILLIAKMPYPLLISVIVGITNMIPYFGPLIGAIPGFFIVCIANPQKAFWFLIIVFALQQFDGLFLGPKILGDSTGLTPFWVIFSIIIGGAFFGAIGMFLGVPVFGVINYLFNKSISKRLKEKNM